MTEPTEVLNPSGLPTGEVKARAAVHEGGDLHRTLHLWFVRDGQVLMQRRAAGKDLEPGKLDVAVGGHFRAGETLLEVLREAREELGVTVAPGELKYLGTFRATRHYPELGDAGIIDNELQESYLLVSDVPLTSYRLDPAEVEVLYELPLEGAVALYEHGAPLAAAGYDAQGRRNDALLIADDLIEQARADVVARLRQIQVLLAEGSQETPDPANVDSVDV